MSCPLISFIIPLYNHLSKTQEMLDSLRASVPSDISYEIILCDDSSTDGTRDWLLNIDNADTQVMMNQLNRGYAYTNNVGAQSAKGIYLGFLNNDLLLKPGWLEPMLQAFDSSNKNVGLVGNLQYRIDNGALDHAGMDLTLTGQFAHIRDLSQYKSSLHKVFGVTGACVIVRRDDFYQVDGFDENLINGCEDLDLCFKLAAIGKFTYLCLDSRVQHHVSLSRDLSAVRNQQNSQYLYKKWRKLISARLSAMWESELSAKPMGNCLGIDGFLSPNFMLDKVHASQVVADAMLVREERSWILVVNGAEKMNDISSGDLYGRGLIPVESIDSYLAEGMFSVDASNLKSIKNFYVCGRKINAQVSGPMAITITIDDVHQKTNILRRGEGNINVGIVNPILLPKVQHSFKVRIDYLDEADQPIQLADKAVLITHFVIDDVIVKNITLMR